MDTNLLRSAAVKTHMCSSIEDHSWTWKWPFTVIYVHARQQKAEEQAATLRVSTAGDADGFVVDLQADGAGELALDALRRGCQRARAAVGLLLLAELGARRHKAPKHRHHGAADDLKSSTTARCPKEEAVQALRQLVASASCREFELTFCKHDGFGST